MSLTETPAPSVSTSSAPPAAPAPPSDLLPRLFAAAPLGALLEATGAELIECDITDDVFYGGAVQRNDGSIFLSMPSGRPGWERECVARDLLARLAGVILPDRLPEGTLPAA